MKQVVSNKYWKIFLASAMHQWQYRIRLLAKVILYFFVIYLYYQIVVTTGAGSERIWYIATTQLMILSFSPITFQIAHNIESGQIDYFLVRPVNYISYTFFSALGESSVKYLILSCCCFVWVSLLTHTFPGLNEFFFGILLGIISLLLYILITIIIGISSFWFNDIKDLFYLNLTACFCFGGLIVPLEFYSGIIKKISFITPYPLILWVPANLISSGSINFTFMAIGTSVWLTLILYLIKILYNKFLSVYLYQGGK